MDELRQRVLDGRKAAHRAERQFLLARGWKEQGTYNDVTWWFYEGMGSSEPQETAVRYALKGVDERVFKKLHDDELAVQASKAADFKMQHVDVLDLGKAIEQRITKLGILTIGNLLEFSRDELLAQDGIGRVTVKMIEKKLIEQHLPDECRFLRLD